MVNKVEDIEENAYFKSVVKDAISDLKSTGSAFVFFKEQVEAIQQLVKEELEVNNDGTFYRLSYKDKRNKK